MIKKILIITIALTLILTTSIAAEKAFLNFEFGDSKEVVREKIIENDKIYNKKSNGEISLLAPKYRINDTEYTVSFSYYNDQLMKVFLMSEKYSSTMFTGAKIANIELIEIIDEEYGTSDEFTFADKVDVDSNNGMLVTSLWDEENKELMVGYVESDFKYSVFLNIIDKELYKKSQSEDKIKTDNEGDF